MSELKPCPFCDTEDGSSLGRVAKNLYIASDLMSPGGCWVVCQGCEASGPDSPNEPEAIAVWNRRASGWVSVKDRLPDLYQMVVGWDGSDIIAEIQRCEREPGWYDYSETDKWSPELDGPITHWQPLPEPPE